MWYIGRNTEISYTTVDVDDRDRPIIARRAMQYLVSTFRSLLLDKWTSQGQLAFLRSILEIFTPSSERSSYHDMGHSENEGGFLFVVSLDPFLYEVLQAKRFASCGGRFRVHT